MSFFGGAPQGPKPGGLFGNNLAPPQQQPQSQFGGQMGIGMQP